jgi:hypothetical protein
LDQDHTKGDEGTLSHEINAILGHGLKDLNNISKTGTWVCDIPG